jgi:hypothetical protein
VWSRCTTPFASSRVVPRNAVRAATPGNQAARGSGDPSSSPAAALAIHAVASLVDAVRVSEITRSQPAFAALNAGHLASVVLGIAALRDLLIRSRPQRDREAAARCRPVLA